MADIATRVFEVEVLVAEASDLIDGGGVEAPAVVASDIEVANPFGAFTTDIECPAVLTFDTESANPYGRITADVEAPAFVSADLETIDES